MTEKRSRGPLLAIIVGGLLIAGCMFFAFAACVSSLNDATKAPTPATRPTTAGGLQPPKAKAPSAVPVAVVVAEGVWSVPAEVKPGTYTTTAGSRETCYWARLSDFDGDDNILANGLINPGARSRITIKPTDSGVEFRGSCRWARG